MDDLANTLAWARALHVIAVVVWIGGVALITAVALPAIRRGDLGPDRVRAFQAIERRFSRIAKIEEPWVKATILVPDEYLGSVLALCTERRGEQVDLTYVGNRAMLVYKLPLNEIVFDFYDRLKSISRGYASFDYEVDDYRESDLVKVNILVNDELVDALSFMAHRSQAESRGRQICERLKDLIPRHLFKIPIQAAIEIGRAHV